jgi:hypothetical protein
VAGVAVHHERLFVSVPERLQLADERQATALLTVQRAHFEDVVRAHAHALGLALAAIAIDDRGHAARLLAFGLCHRRT